MHISNSLSKIKRNESANRSARDISVNKRRNSRGTSYDSKTGSRSGTASKSNRACKTDNSMIIAMGKICDGNKNYR
jgi:hypothetical protein